ncbi:putative bifunctional diguanylate cyclase/phosphodiesterase [Pseudooceanicola nanhaiensis]|uniref:putative bifunctional diguanylate cyclase/phosphodiesterase n=1 Tax=Pseudooceanicola nanhaiensis TaxID=375761 RepID=UPI001CD2C0E0|nr:bifunctional diguanylate cyclase/phosphodiesterase [Pseudooceanicola nanhaiensis]MCA0922731.1 bifunctional diguanylate cyclase/phosphodiesterase [Pseudooceanicola nanhaiensis]
MPGPRLPTLLARIRAAMTGPHMLAFLPAATLGAFWLGGEVLLFIVSLAIPALFGLLIGFGPPPPLKHRASDSVTGLPAPDTLERMLNRVLSDSPGARAGTACFQVRIDDFDVVLDRYGQAAGETLLHRTADRLRGALREADVIVRMGDAQFGIGIAPVTHLDLEVAIQMAARLQSAVEEPISLDSTVIYISCSVGFCLGSRAPRRTAAVLIEAAGEALREAANTAPSSIRAWSEEMRQTRRGRDLGTDEAAAALENGQIVAFFQPQVSTDTGQVSGLESLARWQHPQRGLIGPGEFLPLLEQAGLLERLGEVMLTNALKSLQGWDRAGLKLPMVGVNFTGQELLNPRLIDKVRWELDRFDIAAERLCVEVLETVVAASPDDIVARNINGLAKLGCRIDLDDFGTGHASISSIRRFAVERIKIDRSFVLKVDRDAEQQRMVAAILTMAERLGLDTLAEGVETAGEHAMLAQLGCGHVQGYGIARPMPGDQVRDWMMTYTAGLGSPPEIGHRTG